MKLGDQSKPLAQRSDRITIVDVARRAGVSIGTVSRVLNNLSGRPETRQKVLEAVKALGYVPNHAAQSLKRQSTEQIAIVVPDIANPVYVAMARAVQQVAKDRGYSLALVSTESSSSEEANVIRSLERKHVDGLIICSLRPTDKLVRELESFRERICVIGSLPASARVDNVRVDSMSGVTQAIAHLVEQGRKRIAFINGTVGTVPAEARQAGYIAGLHETGLRFDPELAVNTSFTLDGGYDCIGPLLAAHPDIDAVLCANDIMALGVLRRLRELGQGVPEDVALVGMDDTEFGRISIPTLTSVSLLAGERGRIAAGLLLDRIEGEQRDTQTHSVTVMPHLIIRESSMLPAAPHARPQHKGRTE